MSGILGVFATEDTLPDDLAIRDMLGRMSARGSERIDVGRDACAVLAVARNEWELGPDFSGPALVVHEDDLTIVADASLFYCEDLRRALGQRGVRPTGDTPSHLILAAYRAWGDECAERLEGDFAFLVWDRRTRSVLCCRDFGGRRPLFYAMVDGSLVVASTLGAVVAHPACAADWNEPVIGAAAAGFYAVGHETCYRGVSAVPAGSTLRHGNGTLRITRHWNPPPIRTGKAPLEFEPAAEELRGLLCRAVEERLAKRGPTTVWLSGGWDSTSVFGAGAKVLRDRAGDEHLHAISISYPPGDPGREDELIEAVVTRWNSPITWLDIANIPLLDRPIERAASRDEPFSRAFEMWVRALAGASRATGARVSLDGNGGDQLFQVSNIYLADLFRTGRWLPLAREWRAKRGSGFRNFFRVVVQPNIPRALMPIGAAIRGGRPLRHYLQRPLPAWIDPAFAARAQLVERERHNTPQRWKRNHVAHEMYWYLTYEFSPWVASTVSGFGLEAGIETRSPLYDRRVIEFAASRPWWERSYGRDTNRLLRRSMLGLLPDHVLAPRAMRTGVTTNYLQSGLRNAHASFISGILNQPLMLEELGIIHADRMRQSWQDYLERRNNVGLSLLFTLQVELWLRAQSGISVPAARMAAPSESAA